MKFMRTAAVIFSLSFYLIGAAQAEQPFGSIKSVKTLPIHGVKMIESDKGVFFVSENGRFAWKGPLYDMWNTREVRTLADVEAVVNKVDVRKIGLKPEELATLTFGQGNLEEIIFVSPSCKHCRTLMQQALELGGKYRFRVVLVPMGQKSMEQARKLLCQKDVDAALKALAGGDYDGLQAGDCSLPNLQRTLVAARVLGLRSVPYLIRHDGQVATGEIKDLAGWLAGEKQAKAPKAKGKETKKVKGEAEE